MMKATFTHKSVAVLALTLCATLVVNQSNAQNVLNRGDNEIKSYEAKVGGILRTDRKAQIGTEPHTYDILVYLFPESAQRKNDTLIMSFLFRHGKCYKYIITYKNQNQLPFLIKSFDSSAKFKRSGSGLAWLNTEENYLIEIQKQINVHAGEDPHFAMVIYDKTSE